MTSTAEGSRIGQVRQVLGATVTVEIDNQLAGIEPLWEGRLQPIGQIGTLVRFPQGTTTLIGTVTLVGISELSEPQEPSRAVELGDRWLKVQLVGEINAFNDFQRGVSLYPALDDPVHFVTRSELRSLYPASDENHVTIGALSANNDIPFALNIPRLVVRHSAIVGSTGAGKTSTVATLLQQLAGPRWSGSNIIVVDPHGEYGNALQDVASVSAVIGDSPSLRVPYWLLPSDELLRVLGGSDAQLPRQYFAEHVQAAKIAFKSKASWITLDDRSITSDTPIPFDLHSVWLTMTTENRATYSENNDGGKVCTVRDGDVSGLIPPTFQTYGPSGRSPFKGSRFNHYGSVPDRMRLRLLDPALRFFTEPQGDEADQDPLGNLVESWIAPNKAISVLDFSGVASDVTDIAVGVVLQTLFELAIRGSGTEGIGRAHPILIVLEEAHRYLGTVGEVRIAREAVNRIAREGRKYGIGIMLVSQRPSELPDTALSQVGTIIALRLTNSDDQSRVRSALPDSVAGLAEALPSLRNGEAIITGESTLLPTRVRCRLPDPRPRADDPPFDSWHKNPKELEIADAVRIWRGF